MKMNYSYGKFMRRYVSTIFDYSLSCRVRDRGGGMPQSLLDKIFDYHFSSNELSTLSYADFDNHLYNQLAIKNNQNHMSG